LNDDDALELFKKTLPAPSLIEVKVTLKQQKAQALAALGANRPKDSRLDLIALALKGRKVSMDKVIKMIDDMVDLLADEQKGDDAKKEECEKLIDEHEDKMKVLDGEIGDLDKAIEEAKEGLATSIEDIKSLSQGIKDLDSNVEDATYNRKEEHEDYVTNLAANNAALELLGFAKNRLNKFYNPKMYKAPPKRQLSEEERITTNMGGTLAPTEAPGGIAGTGVTVLAQGAPPPPPETWGAYSKKSEESNGVLAMIDMLAADLEKEIQEMEFEEKDAQKEYEQFMEDAKTKRVTDSKALADREAAKADFEGSLEKLHEEIMRKMKENMAVAETLKDIHLECDWLLQNYDYRKEARAGEREALKKAKAVLSGADYSFIEVARVRQHIQ